MNADEIDSKLIPIFPLKLIVYPYENLNLHIFEARYKQLVNECIAAESSFLIPPHIGGKVKSTATMVRITRLSKTYEDGRMDIKTKGEGLYKLGKIVNPAIGKLYAAAKAEPLNWDMEKNPEKQRSIRKLMIRLHEKLNIYREIPELDDRFSTYRIAHMVGMNLEQEYELLKKLSEAEREKYIEHHLIQLLPVVEEMRRLHLRARMNGHFRNLDQLNF